MTNPKVDEWLAEIAAHDAGRTRYEGQEPRTDEAVAAEIVRLRARETLLLEALALLKSSSCGNVMWFTRRATFLTKTEATP